MKIALASDAHIEFADLEITNDQNADVLILSGDICVAEHLKYDMPSEHDIEMDCLSPNKARMMRYYKFFERCCERFPKVCYIQGNHESYGGNFDKTLGILKDVLKFPNLHIMERDTVEIDDYMFVGSTLWTNCNNMDSMTFYYLRGMLNDYRVIRKGPDYRKFTPEISAGEHIKNMTYIKSMAEEARIKDKKMVVIGHHMPTTLSIADEYKDDFHMNGGYASDLSEFIMDNPVIKLWTCGHTHHSHWYYMGDTLVACNPRGYYPSEESARNFKLKYIDLDNMPSKDVVESNYHWSTK